MDKQAKALTDKQISGAKPKKSKYELVDSTRQRGVGRLVVRITPTGKKEFAFKYQLNSNRRYMSIGTYPNNSLSDARALIVPLSKMLRDGKDPKEEIKSQKRKLDDKQRSEAKNGSVQQLFEFYTTKMKTDKKRTHKAVLKALEKEVYPIILPETKAKDVQPIDIVEILSIMIQRGAVVQSNRVRSYLVTAFNFGLKHDLDPAQKQTKIKFGLTTNPASVVPRQASAEKVGENWLTLDETRELLDTFNSVKRMNPLVSELLALCFHTGGQRPYELVASRKDSINWNEKTLLITTDVSKTKRANLVPLTDNAISVLTKLVKNSEDCEFIFPHFKNRKTHMKPDDLARGVARYRKENPKFKYFVGKDIRRTCKTLMGELGISKETRDRIQNHGHTDISSKHYDRYSYLPEKRQAMRKWEERLIGVKAKVVQLRTTYEN